MTLTTAEKAKLLALINQIKAQSHNAPELEAPLKTLKDEILYAEETR
jgi:hypothetical protein